MARVLVVAGVRIMGCMRIVPTTGTLAHPTSFVVNGRRWTRFGYVSCVCVLPGAIDVGRLRLTAMTSVLIRMVVMRMMMIMSVVVTLGMRHTDPRVDGHCTIVQFMLHKIAGKPYSS